MDHGGRAIRNRHWLKIGEEAGYTSGSVSYSVKVCTRLSLSVVRTVFHWAGFFARNDIFFCLLTPTLLQSVVKAIFR